MKNRTTTFRKSECNNCSNCGLCKKIQNQALRIITGAMKSTPITFMEQTTAIQPLQQRRQASPSSSREIQVPPRSSHEGEGRGPY